MTYNNILFFVVDVIISNNIYKNDNKSNNLQARNSYDVQLIILIVFDIERFPK